MKAMAVPAAPGGLPASAAPGTLGIDIYNDSATVLARASEGADSTGLPHGDPRVEDMRSEAGVHRVAVPMGDGEVSLSVRADEDPGRIPGMVADAMRAAR